MRRVQPRERRDDVHALAAVHAGRHGLDLRQSWNRGTYLGAGSNHSEIVAKPLHQSPRDGDGALQSVARVACGADLVRHGRDQPVLAVHDGIARVHQNKTPRAVRVLHLARFEARLPEQRRLLVAQRPYVPILLQKYPRFSRPPSNRRPCRRPRCRTRCAGERSDPRRRWPADRRPSRAFGCSSSSFDSRW